MRRSGARLSVVTLLTTGAHAFAPSVRLGAARAPPLGSLACPPQSAEYRVGVGRGAARASAPQLLALRGGLAALNPATPDSAFNLIFACLSTACATLVYLTRERKEPGAPAAEQPAAVKSLQWRFLAVFWLFKMADWLQGPYFYEVYASKVINGVAVSSQGIARLFLTGFGSTALFGAVVGGLVDSVGRKRGSLAFSLFYAISALSTRAIALPGLVAGRVAGGIGTSLLFSAPEAWLVSEFTKSNFDGKWLGQIFGLAYFGDAIVAILAGQIAGGVAAARGPTAPFELSVLFLGLGAALVLALWKENYGGVAKVATATDAADGGKSGGGEGEARQSGGAMVKGAVQALRDDRRLLLVGAVQALFEGAMYIFVLQWPPALKAALAGAAVPFGKIFSCFMVCCMLGSTSFSALGRRGVKPEDVMVGMLGLATAAMATATLMAKSFGFSVVPLIGAFFAFEVCVGTYFPLIGTLRGKYLPDAYRGVIMNLFGIPLNLIVVAVFLSIGKLGVWGALACSTTALSLALLSVLILRAMTKDDATE